MKRFLTTLLAGLALLAGSISPALAGPIAYYNQPFDTPNAAVNSLINTLNTSLPSAAGVVACTGTTTATCQGLKIVASITGLTTAAGVTAAQVTVTDASVTAASLVFCQPVGYAGTGNPIAVNVAPAAGTFTFNIQNTHASAALNATVPVACFVYN